MTRRSLLLLVAILFASWLAPTAAIASTKCFCANGVIVQSMDDDADDDDCDDACSEFGGGRLWTPADSASDEDYAEGVDHPVARGAVRTEAAGEVERRR